MSDRLVGLSYPPCVCGHFHFEFPCRAEGVPSRKYFRRCNCETYTPDHASERAVSDTSANGGEANARPDTQWPESSS